jgi:HlyD family secretion protein
LKTLRRTVIGLAVVVAVVLVGYELLRPSPPAVAVHVVGRGLVEATVANTRAGTVNAHRRAKLAPATGGQVTALAVKEGDRVTGGQVLIELWNADLKAQLAVARAEAERAAALVEEARFRSGWASREEKRQEELLRSDISADERVDRARNEARTAAAALQAATAQADVQTHQVEVIAAQLERTQLRAPFAGVVAEVNCEVGEFVTPSPVGIPTPPAIDLIDDREPYVTAPIDEVDAARVREGMTAWITLDAFGSRRFAGRVRRIAPYVTDREKQARTVDVEVEFQEPPADLRLLPGYSADVEILIAARPDVLRLPTETLRDGDRVLLVLADGTLAERTVTTGLANWRYTEVATGVTAGDRVVSSLDQQGLGPGLRVAVRGQPQGNGP